MNFTKLDSIASRFSELTSSLSDPKVIANSSEYIKVAKEHSTMIEVVEAYEGYRKCLRDIESAESMARSETDAEMKQFLADELAELSVRKDSLMDKLRILLLPVDPNDDKNVIMEIRAGAGGDEAGLFASQLMRMYRMYADSKRWKIEEIYSNVSELGGVKEVVFSISGQMVYSNLKFESGVHRVQRVPATETQGRIHTSTVTVAVLPEVEDVVVEINEKDLKIDTYRSGGAGGQHVNKTESAIRITHLPTNIVVQCQDEKSQIKNRDKAMKVLSARLYDHFQSQADSVYASNRKSQVGTGDRSERIRTYNFPQGRVTDHRINMTIYSLDNFMNGDISSMLETLRIADQTAKLENSEE